jgi:hypothetical protein
LGASDPDIPGMDAAQEFQRGERLAPVQNTTSQYNRLAIGNNIADKANRDGVAARCADPAVHKRIEVDLSRIDDYEHLLRD